MDYRFSQHRVSFGGRACNGRAFTLIELLVVITIIVLLISLLIPTLKRARDSAQNVQCGSGLHQLMIGISTYATENKHFLPMHYGGGTHPFTTYWINRQGQPKLTRVNLGLLLFSVSDPQAYYEPSLATDQRSALSYNGPDNPWNDSKGMNPSGNDNRLRSSFPARSLETELGIAGGSLTKWKVDDYRAKVIYSCFVGVDNWNGGGIINGLILAPHSRAGNNALFGDGSVAWIPLDPLHELRPITTVTPTALDMSKYYKRMDERP